MNLRHKSTAAMSQLFTGFPVKRIVTGTNDGSMTFDGEIIQSQNPSSIKFIPNNTNTPLGFHFNENGLLDTISAGDNSEGLSELTNTGLKGQLQQLLMGYMGSLTSIKLINETEVNPKNQDYHDSLLATLIVTPPTGTILKPNEGLTQVSFSLVDPNIDLYQFTPKALDTTQRFLINTLFELLPLDYIQRPRPILDYTIIH